MDQTAVPRTEGLFEWVGNTPLIRLPRLGSELSADVELYAKAEWHNPSGSVKDRPAAAILYGALPQLNGRTLLDSSSGNMGIAYASLAASLGVPVHLAVPANAGKARLAVLEAYGVGLTLTDPLKGSDGARTVAADLAQQHPELYYYADQYSNPANWRAHYESTGPEVLAQSGSRLTHFVAGIGTSGTLIGAGRFLKEALPATRVVGFQPDGPLHAIEGMKHLPTSDVPPIYDPSVADEVIEVDTEQAHQMVLRLAREEGLLVGVSSGAAAAAAMRVAKEIASGVVVTVFADSGLKYMDEPFWSEL